MPHHTSVSLRRRCSVRRNARCLCAISQNRKNCAPGGGGETVLTVLCVTATGFMSFSDIEILPFFPLSPCPSVELKLKVFHLATPMPSRFRNNRFSCAQLDFILSISFFFFFCGAHQTAARFVLTLHRDPPPVCFGSDTKSSLLLSLMPGKHFPILFPFFFVQLKITQRCIYSARDLVAVNTGAQAFIFIFLSSRMFVQPASGSGNKREHSMVVC